MVSDLWRIVRIGADAIQRAVEFFGNLTIDDEVELVPLGAKRGVVAAEKSIIGIVHH